MKIHKNFQEKTEIGFQDLEKLVQTGLIRYVNDNCNSNFIINIAEAYGEIREKSTSNSRFSFNSAVNFKAIKLRDYKRLQMIIKMDLLILDIFLKEQIVILEQILQG